MTSTCILCPTYRRDDTPHTPDVDPVCDVCRWRVHRDMAAVGRLHRDLAVDEVLDRDHRTVAILDALGVPTGQYRWRDPAAAVLPVGAVAGRSGQPVVSGTREPSVPIDLDRIDLTAPARHGTVHDPYHDQIGHISTATVLDSWAYALRAALFATERRPDGSVDALVRWFLTGAPVSRLDTACTRYAAVTDLAGEIRRLCTALRDAAGESEPPPQVLWGVPCRRCKEVSRLVREDLYVACRKCGLLLTLIEYRAWTAQEARRHTPPARPSAQDEAPPAAPVDDGTAEPDRHATSAPVPYDNAAGDPRPHDPDLA